MIDNHHVKHVRVIVVMTETVSGSGRDIVTSAEMKALEKLQRGPAFNHALTPDGPEYQQAQFEIQRWRDARLYHIRNRLTTKQYEFRRGFDRER